MKMKLEDRIIEDAKKTIDILAPKRDFPYFAFGLFEDGWMICHEVIDKKKSKTNLNVNIFTSHYKTYAPSQIGKFSREYVSKIFDVFDKHFGKINEIAAIPYTNERIKEVLSLGNCLGSIKNPDHSYKIIKFEDDRIIKLYTPPNIIMKGESEGTQ